MNRLLATVFVLGCVLAVVYSLPVEEKPDGLVASQISPVAELKPVTAYQQEKLAEDVLALTDGNEDGETDRQKRQFFGGYGGYGGYGGGFRRFGGYGGYGRRFGGYGGYRGFGGYGYGR